MTTSAERISDLCYLIAEITEEDPIAVLFRVAGERGVVDTGRIIAELEEELLEVEDLAEVFWDCWHPEDEPDLLRYSETEEENWM